MPSTNFPSSILSAGTQAPCLLGFMRSPHLPHYIFLSSTANYLFCFSVIFYLCFTSSSCPTHLELFSNSCSSTTLSSSSPFIPEILHTLISVFQHSFLNYCWVSCVYWILKSSRQETGVSLCKCIQCFVRVYLYCSRAQKSQSWVRPNCASRYTNTYKIRILASRCHELFILTWQVQL